MVACLHDVLFCLAFLCFFGYEITLNVIAALLTLVGYSVNDTIVIFDRVRENLKQRARSRSRKILNDSVNQTLTRTLISNGTTFLAVLGLYLFGGEVLSGFGFTMVVGILVGHLLHDLHRGADRGLVVGAQKAGGARARPPWGRPRPRFNLLFIFWTPEGTPTRGVASKARGDCGC